MIEQPIWVHKANPWEPADYDDKVIFAVRRVKEQHPLFWDWLMHASGEDDWAYRPDAFGGQRATDVALGKQLVAKQLKKMLNPALNPKKVETSTPARPVRPRPRPGQGRRGKRR